MNIKLNVYECIMNIKSIPNMIENKPRLLNEEINVLMNVKQKSN